MNCIGALCLLQFKQFEFYWGAVFFTTRREVLEKPFFLINSFEWFVKREMKCVKKIEVILVLNKNEERSEKRVVFVHTAVFERARNWCVKKIFSKRAKFFCSPAAFTSSFLQFLTFLRFDYDIVIGLGLFW